MTQGVTSQHARLIEAVGEQLGAHSTKQQRAEKADHKHDNEKGGLSLIHISFWLISMGPLSSLKICIIRMLSGSIIPLWFFPEWLRNILAFLPFQYIYQLPLSIYIGKLTEQETIFQIGVQLVWLLILYGLYRLMQKKVLTNVMVQGG